MNQALITLGSFALTGAIVSVVAQFTKQWFSSSPYKVLYVALLSVVVGAIIYFINFIPADIITIILGVWASANTVYLVAVKWFE